MFNSDRYLLSGPLDASKDYVQYWSKTKGWVPRESATLFTLNETESFETPQGTLGWIKYQELGYKHDL